MLPRPYLGSYSGEKGHEIMQQSWIIALAKSVETFIIVSINEMPTIKYWQNLGRIMEVIWSVLRRALTLGKLANVFGVIERFRSHKHIWISRTI